MLYYMRIVLHAKSLKPFLFTNSFFSQLDTKEPCAVKTNAKVFKYRIINVEKQLCRTAF